jgi:hypothetical protein
MTTRRRIGVEHELVVSLASWMTLSWVWMDRLRFWDGDAVVVGLVRIRWERY